MTWPDKEYCIKCDGGGKVLLCNNSTCPLSVHEKCLGFPVKFDELGSFYCPYCVYRQFSEELNLAQERTLLRKKALLNFLDNKSTSEDCRSTSSKEPAWSLDNENHLKGPRDPEDTLLEKADQQQDRFAAGFSERDLQSEDSIDFVEETDEDIDESAERFEMVNTSNSAPSQPQNKQDVHKPQKTVENHIKDDCSWDPFVTEKEGGEIFVEVDKVDDDARTAQETDGNIERTKVVEEQVLKTVALPQGDLAVEGNVLKKRRSKAKHSSHTESETELNGKHRMYKDKNSNDDAKTTQENVGNIEGAEEVEEQVQRKVALPQGDLAQGNDLKKRRSKAKRSSRTESETELNGKCRKYNDKKSNDDARTVGNIEEAEEVEEQVTVALPQGDLAQGDASKKRRSKSKRSSRKESETELNGKCPKYNDKNSNDEARTAQETVGNIEGAEEVEEQIQKTVALPQDDLAVQGNVLKKRRSEAKRSSRTESETELNGKRCKYNGKNSNDDARTDQETVGNIDGAEEVEEQVERTVALPQSDLAQGNVKKKRRSKAKRSSHIESETKLNGKRRKYNDKNKNSNDDARTAQEIVGNIEGAEEVEEQVQRTVAMPQGDLAQENVKKKRRSKAKRSSRIESETKLNGKRRKYNDKNKNSNDDGRTAQETVGNIEGAEEVEEQVQRTVASQQGDLAQGNVFKKRKSEAKRSSRTESETELNGKCRKYNDKNKNSNDDTRTAQETVGNIEGAEEVEEQLERTVASQQGDFAQGSVFEKRKSEAKRSSRTESEAELNGKRRKYNYKNKNSNDDARTDRETVGNIDGAEEVEEQVERTVALPQGDLAQGNVLKKRSEAKHLSCTESETKFNGKRRKYNDKTSNESTDTNAAQGNVSIKLSFEAGNSTRTEAETELNEKCCKHNDKNSNKFTTVNGTSQNLASASRACPDKIPSSNEPKKRTVPASRILISGERRTRLPWTDEEVNMLKEGFGKIFNDETRCISWTNILDYGRHVFDGTRTPGDLKDKWRNLYGRDWENYSPNWKNL